METETISSKRNNCTLVAVQEVSRKPDAEIFKAFRAEGYRDHEGMQNYRWIAAAKGVGLEIEEVSTKAANSSSRWSTSLMTLAEFIRAYNKGVYFISVSGHALVVREGRIVDKNQKYKLGLRRRVYFAHRVLNAPFIATRGGDKLVVKIPTYWAKRRGTPSFHRYVEMAGYLNENPNAKLADILANTSYTKADYNHDLKKGLIAYE